MCSHTPQERIKVIFYTQTKVGFENSSYYYYSFLKKLRQKIKKKAKIKGNDKYSVGFFLHSLEKDL